MNNTIQLYIDDEKKTKGYPITSPDRVVDENGKSVQQDIKKINMQLETKLNKNDTLNMANMGQDIKEAMTGGSVAVIGSNVVDMANFSRRIQEDIGVISVKDSTTEKGYATISNNIVTGYGEQTYWHHSIVDCIVGQVWKVKFTTLPNINIKAYVFVLDSSNRILAEWYKGVNEVNAVELEIEIPKNGSKLLIHSNKSDIYHAVYEYTPISTKKELLEYGEYANNTFIDTEFMKKIYDVDSIVSNENVKYSLTNNKQIVFGTNTATSAEQCSIVEFDCIGREYYEVKGLLVGTREKYAVQFYNSSDKVIGAITTHKEHTGAILIYTPPNTVKCRYTCHTNNIHQGVFIKKFTDIDNSVKPFYVYFPIDSQPSFTVNGYELTVTLPSINKFFVRTDEVQQINYDSNSNNFTIPNNNVLGLNLTEKRLSVYSSDESLNSDVIPLLFNSYGIVAYGEWKKYYDIEQLKKSIKELTNKVPEGEGNVNSTTDISYYKEHLDSKIKTINSLQSKYIKGDCISFLTDVHVKDNVMKSPLLLKEICKKTGVNKIVCGGDLITAFGTKEELFDMGYKGINSLYENRDCAKIYMLRGNHDLAIRLNDGDVSPGYTATKAEIYNMFMRRQEEYVVKDFGDKLYFYFDNPISKIRYICLDTSELGNNWGTETAWGVGYGVSQQQVNWLINTALNINEEGWSVLFIGHISVNSNISGYSNTLQPIDELIKSLKHKRLCEYNSNGISINTSFADSKLDVIAYICGHNHKDESYYDDGILYMSTACDAYYGDDGIPRTKGTITETAFDVININLETRTINLTRIGAGSDRKFNY